MKKILLIEDEENIRLLYAELLETEGYLVDQVSDGEQALNKLRQGGYDLVLLDLILPKMDGLTILQELQKSPPTQANGPLIVLTNLSQDQKLAETKKLGAADSLIKSDITPDQLIAKVKSYLPDHDQEQQ